MKQGAASLIPVANINNKAKAKNALTNALFQAPLARVQAAMTSIPITTSAIKPRIPCSASIRVYSV